MAKKKKTTKNKLHIKKNVRDLIIFLVIATILGLVFMNVAFTLIMLLGIVFILWLSNFFSKKKKKKWVRITINCFAILILLLEMPTWVINFSISFNITLGIVLLMISLYVNKPLELAAFPSILLIGTVFRLVLSIASTRLILAKGDAGEVVEAFGNFVTGGNMVVGGVIFLIINSIYRGY